MNKRVIFGLLLGCLIATLLVVVMSNMKEAKAVPVEKATPHRFLHCQYNEDANGKLLHMTAYTIYNLSISRDVTLGDVYIMDETGTIVKQWTPPTTLIGPLGHYGFAIQQTGVSPQTPYGGYLIAITWNGREEDVGVTGGVAAFDTNGNKIGISHIYPFEK